MTYLADRVKDTTTTTGTGDITLAGSAPTGFRTFAVGFDSLPCMVAYAIVGATGEWEIGRGYFDGATGLSRDVVMSSSNANAPVSFSAGTKDVFCTANAEIVDNANAGKLYAMARGFGMP